MVAIAVASAALTLGACSGDALDEDRLAEDLIEESGGALDEDQATCVADGLAAAFGDDSYQRVLDAATGDTDDDDVRTEVIDIFAGCDALDTVVLDGP